VQGEVTKAVTAGQRSRAAAEAGQFAETTKVLAAVGPRGLTPAVEASDQKFYHQKHHSGKRGAWIMKYP